LYQKNKNVLKN